MRVERVTSPERRLRHVRSGFTLLELLVVVTIITLLVSILLPSLQRARKAAKRTTCLARLRAIAATSRVYAADDRQGWCIPIHPEFAQQEPAAPTFIGAYEWGGKSGVGWSDFLGADDPLNSRYGTRAGYGPATRPLNALFFQSGFVDYRRTDDPVGMLSDTELALDQFMCPSDDGPPRAAHCSEWIAHGDRPSFDHFGTSFVANTFMINAFENDLWSNGPFLRPVSRVPTPARTLLYRENIGRWAWAVRNDPCDFIEGLDPGPTKTIEGWHGEAWRFSNSFVDGHAEYQPMIEQGSIDIFGYSAHYRTEFLAYYPRWASDGPETFRTYRCVIIRGDGWQLDTLPAPPIATRLTTPEDGHTRGDVGASGCVMSE